MVFGVVFGVAVGVYVAFAYVGKDENGWKWGWPVELYNGLKNWGQ